MSKQHRPDHAIKGFLVSMDSRTIAIMSTFLHQLNDAVESFETMAAAREPNRTMVITGAIGLNSLCDGRVGGQSVIDAAAILTNLATGGAFKLDGPSRLRFGQLAEAVREHVSALEWIDASQAADLLSRQRAVSC